MPTTTVGELGAKLPIGFLNQKTGNLDKDFVMRPYKAKIDRFLALWTEANEDKHEGHKVAKLVSLLCSQVGDTAYALTEEGDSTPEFELAVRDWWYADVMYFFLYTRIKALGKLCMVPYLCPNPRCKHTGRKTADLTTIEVTTIETAKDLEHKVALLDGIPLRGGKDKDSPRKTARALTLAPMKFRAMLLPGGAAQLAHGLGYIAIKDSVVGVDCVNGHYNFVDEELDELSKRDLVLLDRMCGSTMAGADLRTTVACDKCETPVVDLLDWSFNHFFGSSVPLATLLT